MTSETRGTGAQFDQHALTDIETLQCPAVEGARVAALRWLADLQSARAEWHAAYALNESTTAPLHAMRTALRRLRSTLSNQRELLEESVRRRDRRALRALQDGTGRSRDRDVHVQLLRHLHESLSNAAQIDADQLIARLQRRRQRFRLADNRTFNRTIDRIGNELAERLAAYTLSLRVGETPRLLAYGDALAKSFNRSAKRLRRALRRAHDTAAVAKEPDWHRIRVWLKLQRAMVTPWPDAHPDVRAWFDVASEGQRLLGQLNDLRLLERRARRRRLLALSEALQDRMAAQLELVELWAAPIDDIFRASRLAARALRQLAHPSPLANAAHTTVVTSSSAHSSALRHVPTIPDDHGLPMEIERKFLLHGLPPEAAVAPSQLIEQGWIPGTLLRERLRRTLGPNGVERLTRTIKLGRPGSRIEVEEPTDAVLFSQLWPLTVNARIRKRRHLVTDGELTWEVDVFLDRDLVLAEVELADEHQAVAPPAWLAPFIVREVTDEPAYLNSVMAVRDVPAPDRTAP